MTNLIAEVDLKNIALLVIGAVKIKSEKYPVIRFNKGLVSKICKMGYKEISIKSRFQVYYDDLVKLDDLVLKNIIAYSRQCKNLWIHSVKYMLKKSLESMTLCYCELHGNI